MKIRNFTASNLAEAMDMVKQSLGVDAVIMSTSTEHGKICITAAIEEDDLIFDNDNQQFNIQKPVTYNDTLLRENLIYHGVLDVVKDRILASVRQISSQENITNDTILLEKAFSSFFHYSSILDLNNPLKMFMGVSGSGKSTAIAKVATQAKIKNLRCCIISTDNVRAGANNQLEAFAKILNTDFYFCKNERHLYEMSNKAKSSYDLVLIDTPGINPFIQEEISKLCSFIDVLKADMILTMDAGKNTYEAVEIADIFAELGVKYFLPTRLDLTRRIGALLSVASCCQLQFCAASVSSKIAQGLADIDSKSLAKLILVSD